MVFLPSEIVTSSIANSSRKIIVDPQFAIETRDVVDFLGEFGPFNGRYIPRFPPDWTERVQDHVEELSIKDPVKRQGIFERLRREAFLCTVPVGWKWESGQPWRTNIEQAALSDEVPLVIGNALDPEPFRAWIDALEEIRDTRRRSWPFHGVIAEYVDACMPLLVNSPSAYLVDPYLDLFSELGEMLLRSLFEKTKGSRCYAIEVITRRSACRSNHREKDAALIADAEIESVLQKIYKNILPKDRELKLHLVSEGKTGEHSLRLHDRFFLTKHGAINFGQGFLVLKQPLPQQNAYVLDKEHHLVLKNTYIDGVARHGEQLPRIPKIAYPLAVNTFVCKSSNRPT